MSIFFDKHAIHKGEMALTEWALFSVWMKGSQDGTEPTLGDIARSRSKCTAGSGSPELGGRVDKQPQGCLRVAKVGKDGKG